MRTPVTLASLATLAGGKVRNALFSLPWAAIASGTGFMGFSRTPALRVVGNKEAILDPAPFNAEADLQQLGSPPPKLPKVPKAEGINGENFSLFRCFSPLRDDGIETSNPRLFRRHTVINLSKCIFLFSHIPSHFRLVFFVRVVLPSLFYERPSYILKHLVSLVGGEFITRTLAHRPSHSACNGWRAVSSGLLAVRSFQSSHAVQSSQWVSSVGTGAGSSNTRRRAQR